MWLRAFTLDDAPGLSRTLSYNEIGPGLVLLYGPNASGKSTIGRLIQASLWPKTTHPFRAKTHWVVEAQGPLIQASLAYGRTQWQGDLTLPSPGLAGAWQLSLSELLRADSSTDSAIAEEIRVALNGGYDLASLAQKPKLTFGRATKTALNDARTMRNDALSLANALHYEEHTLASLEAEERDSHTARDELSIVRAQLKAAQVLIQLKPIDEKLQALPENIATVPDTDLVGTWRALKDHLTRAEADRKKREDSVRLFDDQAGAFTFPNTPPSVALMNSFHDRAEALALEERDRRELAKRVAQAQAELSSCAGQVWAHPSAETTITPNLLDALHQAQIGLNTANSQRAGLSPVVQPSRPPLTPSELRKLKDARSIVEDWLGCPRPIVAKATTPRPTHFWPYFVVSALLLFLLGGLLWFLQPTAGLTLLFLAALLLGLGLGLFAAHPRTSGSSLPPSRLSELESAYTQTNQIPPSSWTTQTVRSLRSALADQLVNDDTLRREEQRYKENSIRHQVAEEHHLEAHQTLNSVLEELGLSTDFGPLAQTLQANRLVALAAAQVQAQTLLAEYEHLDTRHKNERALLLIDLTAFESDPMAASLTPLERVTHLGAQLRAHDLARASLKNALDELPRAQNQRDERAKSLEEHLIACGIEALPESEHQGVLTKRMHHRATWKRGITERQTLEAILASLPELPHGVSVESLNTRIATLKRRSDQAQPLAEQLGALKHRLKAAQGGHTMSESLQALEQARDAAKADLKSKSEGHARAALLNWLQSTTEAHNQPTLLNSARTWLLRFTQNRYQLEVNQDGRFFAIDLHSGQHQALASLSDGSRIQLLLAARLAFIENAESNHSPLPLFLDETLSTTDEQRFFAIASAVLEMTRSGRQVFYASAQRAEVQALKGFFSDNNEHPHLIDLSPSPVSWSTSPTLPKPSPLVEPPKPGMNALAYTKALGFSRPTLHTPVHTWPLPLVWFDALDVAHDAMTQGVNVLGQLDLPTGLDDDQLTTARSRAWVLKSAIRCLQIGRGRPVTWAHLKDSGGVTSSYETRVQTVLDEWGEQPMAFLSHLKEIGGFRKKQAEKIASYLADEGVLDERPILTPHEIFERVCRESDAVISTGGLNQHEVRELVRFASEIVLGETRTV